MSSDEIARHAAREWLPRFTLDRSHLLVGWWKGPHLQWEFGAYVHLDLGLSERHDYRLTYNYPDWRIHGARMWGQQEPLPRFQFERP